MTDTKQSLTVLKVNGEVFARTPGGNLRLLKPGDVLHEGDLLVTASGSTVLQDASGQTLELPPNHSVRIGPDGLDSLHGQTELSTPSADPQPAGPITEDGAATGGTRANTAETGSGEAEDGGLREGDGHGFVRLSRIDYRGFGEAADPGRLGRDVNDTHDFDARATLNPRLAYFHDLPEGNLGTLLPETEHPFWSDEASAAPGWANRRPIANPDSAETDEDVPVVIDPLPNDTDADGHALSIVEATALNGSVTINPDGTVTYTPAEDFHGTDTLTYTITDGYGGTSTSTVTVTVRPVVDIANDTISTNEDTAVTTDVLANDTFGPNAAVTSVTQGTHGAVSINPDGTVTYTPNEDYHGSDSYTYTVTTAAGNTETATVSVTVNSVVDVSNDTISTNEDTAVTTDVLANDTFGPNAAVTSVTQGTHGTVAINPDGTVTYTPNEDYHGGDSYTYTVTTAAGNTETATVSVTVNSVVDISKDTISTNEDTAVTTDVLANDTFGPNASVTSVTQGTHGTVAINPDGTVTYTPNEDYHGSDSYTYTVTTAAGNTETATVSVTVNSVVDISNDTISTNEDTAVTTDVLANDTFGPNASVTSVTQGTHGTVAINPDGTVTYTPNEDYHGSDSYTYTVTTDAGNTETATVNVTVNSVVDIAADTISTNEDTAVTTDVLANDTFGPNAAVTSVTQGTHGTVAINPDGTVTYTPNEDYHGSDSYTYTVTTAAGNTETATVSVTVNSVVDIAADTISTNEDTAVTTDVLANDTFGPNAAVTSITQGTHGTVAINPDGTVTYTPNEDYHGPDSYTYTVTTAAGNTETATVNITVNPVVDIANDTISTNEDTAVTTDVLANDTFGPNAAVTSITQGTHGTVAINPDGTVTYTPNEDYHGPDSYTYTVTTAAGNTETATVNITVNPVVDIAADTISTNEDTAVTTDVLANDTFGPNASVTSVTQGTHGTVSINPDGTVTYTPNEDYHGSDSYTYTVTTAAGNTETATVNVTVNSVVDAFNNTVSTNEDTAVTTDVLANDTFGPNASVTSVTQGTHGTVAINPDGTVTYTPNEDYHGSDSYTYTVTTAAGNTETATVNVTVNSVVDIAADTISTNEDTAVTTDVLANDTFGPNAAVTSVTQGTHGAVSINPDGTVTYTPGASFDDLAVGQTRMDSYTYTVITAAGNTETATVTVTVRGANDAPDITVGAGDTASAGLTETNSGLSASGTLSIFDVDTTNTVTAAKVNSVSVGGTYTGPRPSDAALIAMFSASGGDPSATQQSNPNGIGWAFNSGSEAFNFLPAGQTLTLTYTVRATDSSGAADDQAVTVTITGVNDSGSLAADSPSVNEDTALNGNVLTNDTPDPDYNEPLSVSQFTVAGDPATYLAGQTATIAGAGSLVMNANGTYTFTPLANYSGPVPVVTYTAGNSTFSGTSTLTISVAPRSDAPSWPAHAGVTTNEDTMVALNLKMPVITDNTDKNGALAGDSPERLGFITLESVDTGTRIYKGDGTTLLFTGTNSTMRIVIVDGTGNLDTSVHYTDLTSDPSYASAVKLTKAEFEALMAMPPAERHNDVDMTLRVTSFETSDSGNRLTAVAGTAATRAVHVEVLGVTDPVDLKIAGSDVSHSVTINEDSALDLKSLLSTSFNDTDGSEQRSIVLGNLPAGTLVNGVAVGASGTVTLTLAGGNTLPSITITPPPNSSGDINGITVTLRAQDTDGDSTHTPAVVTDTVTLDLHVNPVAGDIGVSGVTTAEDTGTKFLANLAVTDTDGSEAITAITVNDLPAGWVLRDAGGNVVHTGDGSTDFTVSAADVANGNYLDYTLAPAGHSSTDIQVSISVQTTDTQTVNGSQVTSVVTTALSVPVTVTPAAETVGTDSNGDGTADLSMNGDFTYATPAAEDTWFALSTDGFDFKTPWANQDADGSEQTFALLTPVLNGGATTAAGSRFTYFDGTTTHTLTYTGIPVEIPVAYLDTVQFRAPDNVSGSFEIQVQAKTVDTDPDTGTVSTAVSGSASLDNLIVLPVADQVTLSVSSPATGSEDNAIPLSIRPTSSDPSETFNVTISGIPGGSTLFYNGIAQPVSGGSVTIEQFDRGLPLSILPPANSNSDFTLQVSAVSVDTLGGYTSTSIAAILPISVDVRGVADAAAVTTGNHATTEAAVDGSGHAIPLSSVITAAAPTDSDGSESLALTITGLDPQFTIRGATFLGGTGESRVWLVNPADLSSAAIVTPGNFSGTVDLSVRPTTTENDGNSLTGAWIPVSATVAPSPEAAMTTSTLAYEDTMTRLNLSILPQNGDTDETLSSVWIKAADVDAQPFTLHLGSSGTATLAQAAATPGSGVVLEDGWYKITGPAIGNIYAQGDPNADGSYAFDVRYGVTDPSSDGTLAPVTTQTDASYTLTVRAVTDDTEVVLSGITPSDGNATVIGSTVTATGNTSISIDVAVNPLPDPAAGNQPDVDGSERLVRFIIDGVPDGVTVQGGVYIGDTPGNPNTARWLVDVDPDAVIDGTVTQTLVFNLDGTADELANLNQAITITAVNRDTGSFLNESGQTWTLVTPTNFDGSGAAADLPAEITANTFTPVATANEDAPINLNDLVDLSIDGNSPFSVTLTGLPAGTQVTGMLQTTVNGEAIWTASGSGGNAALQSLLSGITVTPPANWNENNHPGGLEFDTVLTTYAPGGQQNVEHVIVSQPVTPVTDASTLTPAAPDVDEGAPVPITLAVSNPADGPATGIVEGKLYIRLDETNMDTPGTLLHEGNPVAAQAISGVPGIPDGTYYVVDGVDNGETVPLSYLPGGHASGTVTLTATLVSQEAGAANLVTSTVTDSFNVNPVNSGYDLSAGDIAGNEDTRIQLDLSGTGLVDTDGSEDTVAATLGKVPDGYLVYVGSSAASATLASNIGDDGSGTNTWALPLENGALPAYIAILPPENASGEVSGLTLTVLSGEEGLEPVQSTATFDLLVNPVADGLSLSPSLSFGTEGDPVSLNLNATMLDADGSESVTLQLSGLGEHADFFAGSTRLSTSYDAGSDTYTLSGIAPGDINDLSVIQSARSASVNVTAYTVENTNGDLSPSSSASVTVNIAQEAATAGNDTLLYDGSRSYDGLSGIDTLVLRPGESIDFGTDPAIRNIEILDLAKSGSNHTLDNLSIQDVLDITDANHTLTILGDAGDSVNLVDDGQWSHSGQVTENISGVDITFDVYTHGIFTDVTVKIQEEISDALS